MPTWNPNNCILTTEGNKILTKLSTGQGSIEITKVKVGLYVSDSDPALSDLGDTTEIPHIATDLEAEVNNVTNNGSYSSVSISVMNTESTTKVVKFCQIGIYVKYSGDNSEVLYMIAQCDSGEFEQVPIYSESPTVFFYNLNIQHGYTSGMTVEIAQDAFVEPTRFLEVEKNLKTLTENFNKNKVAVDNSLKTLNDKADENYNTLNEKINSQKINIEEGSISLASFYGVPLEAYYQKIEQKVTIYFKGLSTHYQFPPVARGYQLTLPFTSDHDAYFIVGITDSGVQETIKITENSNIAELRIETEDLTLKDTGIVGGIFTYFSME